MGKGRRLTSSRSERLLGSYGYGHGYGANGNDVAEFDEDDVWSTVDSGADRGEDGMENPQLVWAPGAPEESGGRGRSRVPLGGLSLAFEDSGVRPSSRIVHQFRGNDGVASSPPRGHEHGHHMATSAPVNVPDWSKIYRADSVESLHDSDDGLEERDSEMVPPHEYLAREYARSQKAAATSVFEGVGRTLKGRDMRRMRDAVWSQTGFDG